VGLCFPELVNEGFSILLDDEVSKDDVHVDVGVIREAALPRGVRLMGVGGSRTPSPVLFKERHRLPTRQDEAPPSKRGKRRRRSDLDDDDDDTQDIFI
jgi:hypothetical protein